MLNQRQNNLQQIPVFDERLLTESLDAISDQLGEENADSIKSWIEDGSKNNAAAGQGGEP